MKDQKPRARLYVNGELSEGAEHDLQAGQAHYLKNVMRGSVGDALALFNGLDGEWLGRISALSRGAATVTLETRLRAQSAGPDLWLCFAPLKKSATDFVIAKATELGVSAIQPVTTRHSESARVNLDRLRATAIEAAEQTERLDVPPILAPLTLDVLIADWPEDRTLLVAAESGASRPIAELVAELAGRPAAVLVGPEGGFAKSELDGLRELPFVHAVGLGPRILRADTAALAALTCWQAVAGDWRERPPGRSN